jgi:hypothetical protein
LLNWVYVATAIGATMPLLMIYKQHVQFLYGMSTAAAYISGKYKKVL